MVSTRLAALFGAMMFVFALSACGGSDDSSSSATAAVAEAAEDAMDEAAETASDAMEAAGEMADDAADAAGEMADDAMAAAGEMADDAMEAAGEMADDAMEAAEEAVEEATEAVAAATGGEGCTFDVKVGDQLAFSTSSISAPASCGSVTVNLTHTGNLPKAAMGHNWVLIPKDQVEAVATAGMSAGVDGNYLADGEDRYIAATKIIGGGESDSVTFSLSDLDPDAEYMYICTFPGHWSVMRGTFTIS
ncbi:MAG: azurin [Pseudomonadota bacterium]